MSLVGAILDLATDPEPVHLKRVVPLLQHVELEAQRGVAKVKATNDVEASVDVFSRNERLEFFEAEKVLLVERTQTIESRLELGHENFGFRRCDAHGLQRIVREAKFFK